MRYRRVAEALDLVVIEDAEVGYSEGEWMAVVLDRVGHPGVVRGGLLIQAFGSCSHCDDWLAAPDALNRLRIAERMLESIMWFTTPASMRAGMIRQTSAWDIDDPDPQTEFFESAIDKLRLPSWEDVYLTHLQTCSTSIFCDQEHPEDLPLATINEINAIGVGVMP